MTTADDAAHALADAALGQGLTVAVAESLTAGMICSAAGAAPQASQWLRGGVVAYASEVKYDVLGVPRGPVVTQEAAEQMAVGVRGLLGADVGVGVTGAGGPDPQDGQPPGTVWLATCSPQGVRTRRLQLEGSPQEILAETAVEALRMAVDAVAHAR